ncbi:hypothetical protein [Caulobacter segnis]
MVMPAEIMERLRALPAHLQPQNRRFYVEAVSDETKAPMAEFYRQEAEAEKAAHAWAKTHGASGFYPPYRSWGRDSVSARVFAFKEKPEGGAWSEAGRSYVTQRGTIALHPSKRPAGKLLTAELEALPKFPSYGLAIDHLGAVTDLHTTRGDGGKSANGVGHSDGKWYHTVPVSFADRFFISAVNHNFDIARMAASAEVHLAGENPEWATSLEFIGDPISWRPGDGWSFLTEADLDFLVAEENARRAKLRAEAA